MLEFEKLEQFEQDQEQDLLSEEGPQLESDTPAADLPEDWAELMDDDEALLPNEEDDIDGTEQAPETEEKPKRRSRMQPLPPLMRKTEILMRRSSRSLSRNPSPQMQNYRKMPAKRMAPFSRRTQNRGS